MPGNRSSMRVLIQIAYGLAGLGLLVIGYVTFSSSSEESLLASRIESATTTIQLTDATFNGLQMAESGQRGYVLTHDSSYLRSYDTARLEFEDRISQLRTMVIRNVADRQTVDSIEHLGSQKFEEMEKVIDVFRTKGTDQAVTVIKEGVGLRLMEAIRPEILMLRQSVDTRRSALENESQKIRWSSDMYLMGGRLLAFFAVLGAAFLLTRDSIRQKKVETSLQQAIATQTAILDSVGSAIIVTDARGTITTFNRTAEAWLGYSALEVVGKSTPGIFHDPAEVIARAQELTIELGEPIAPGLDTFVIQARKGIAASKEWTFIAKDGHTFPALMTINAVRDSNGILIGYVGLSYDLTEQKATQAILDKYVADLEAAGKLAADQNKELKLRASELKESSDAAVAATRMKSEFLANMSHEIRTPMNGVIGMAHLLLNTPLTEKQQGYARTIRQSAESLLAILNDILDLSKMEAGKMTLENFPFDLRLMLEDLCDVIAPQAHAKGLELNCVIPPSVPSRVIGDPGRLRQILTNLMGNGIKFTERGEVSMSVRVLKENQKRVSYRIMVADTGIGIATDRQDRIFDSFTQADGTTTRKYGGTGLGLTISRQLAELMGGEIGVTSNQGEGSEFWLEMAFQKQPAQKVEPERLRQDLGGIRVLIADDNATNRYILREMLQSWNCRSEEAANGSEALTTITLSGGDPFACVIMDLHMPTMDGLQSARMIKRDVRFKDLPLILLSSSGFAPPDLESASLYAAVLSKPVRSSPLYNALSHVTGITASAGEPEKREAAVEVGEILKGVRVLVVEDNAVNQLVVSELLETWGCHVVTAQNGLIAVEATAKEKFDAILMDVQMPVMDGFEATAAIRAQEELTNTHTDIIAMTANAMSGDRERCLRAGMDSYLSKPLHPALLLEKLAQASGRQIVGGGETQDAETSAESTFDPSRLDESCSGNTQLKLKVIDRYLSSSLDSLKQIGEAVVGNDIKAVKAAAHALKGSSLTIGANRVGHLCQDIEMAVQSDDPQLAEAGLSVLAESLRTELMALLNDLKAYVETLQKADA